MPTHQKTHLVELPLWLREPQVPRQPELPGLHRVVRTPGQSGTTADRPTTPAPPPAKEKPTVRPPAR